MLMLIISRFSHLTLFEFHYFFRLNPNQENKIWIDLMEHAEPDCDFFLYSFPLLAAIFWRYDVTFFRFAGRDQQCARELQTSSGQGSADILHSQRSAQDQPHVPVLSEGLLGGVSQGHG